MGEAQAVKARLRQLRARRRELEGQLAAGGRTRAAQLELAGVEEDLVACARRLRELEPRHRISCRTTWADVEGRAWDQLQYRTWAELEGAQPPQGPSPREEMLTALRQAREDLTPTQRAYLLRAEHGARTTQVAAALGRSPSTVSRGLSRARARLGKKARMVYQLRRAAGEGTLDLSRREGMAALLDALTDRQMLYIFLYYGEWMSLGEISALLRVDRSSVLRTIRRGLERLEQALGPGARVEGLEELEELLVERWSEPPPDTELTAPARARPGVGTGRPAPAQPPEGRPWAVSLVLVRVRGGLRAWLEERRAELARRWGPRRAGRALGRALSCLLGRLRGWLSGHT